MCMPKRDDDATARQGCAPMSERSALSEPGWCAFVWWTPGESSPRRKMELMPEGMIHGSAGRVTELVDAEDVGTNDVEGVAVARSVAVQAEVCD
jgi:hypothetical protein